MEITGRIRIARGLFADYGYDIQSAKQLGVPTALLQSNPYVINGSQILLIPLHKQTLGIDWSTPAGFEAHIDAEHLDDYNGLNRPGYIDANGFIKQALSRHATITLGVFNIFNTDAQIYDLIGAGAFQAQNPTGTAANAFQENNVKLRGLTPRAVDLSVSLRI